MEFLSNSPGISDYDIFRITILLLFNKFMTWIRGVTFNWCNTRGLHLLDRRICANKQGSHGIEKPGKSREFVLVFCPGLEVWNFVENPGNFA